MNGGAQFRGLKVAENDVFGSYLSVVSFAGLLSN